MKLVKKLMLGLVAAAAVIALAGCVMPTDDENSTIKKGTGKYTIDYTYEKPAGSTDDNYRAYKSTGLKHAGALVKLTFKGDQDPGASKLGVIFGLTEDKTAKTRDFNIIGVSKNGQYYVSTMTDIVDIQDNNFGATTNAKAGEPKEKEWVPITSGNSNLKMPTATDAGVSVYVWYQAVPAGNYKWAILDMTDEQATAWKKLTKADKKAGNVPTATKVLAQGTITGAFEAVTEDYKEPQYPISVYAMVKDGKTLKGEWGMIGYYLEAEDAE
jgi:hypothetical protein